MAINNSPNPVPLDLLNPAPTVSLNATQGPQYSPDHLDDLSQKYDQALGPSSPGVPAVATALSTNTEDRLNQLLATKKALDLETTRNSLIQEIANRSGGSPSPQDLAAVGGLSNQDLSSPSIGAALEQEYAKQTVNFGLDQSNSATGQYDQAIQADPNTTNQVLDRSEYQTARNLISSNILDDVQQKYGQANLLQKGLAWAQTLVPFRSWYAQNTFLGSDTPANVRDLLPGNTVQDNISYLHTLPPAEYKTVLQAATDRLVSQGDYLDAQQLVQATLSYGDSDKNWADLFAGLDVASVLPVGSIAKVARGASKAVTMAAKDVEAGSAVQNFLDKSAQFSMDKSLSNGLLPSFDIQSMPDVEKNLLSISRPAQVFTDTQTKAPAAVTGRLETTWLQQQAESRALAAQEILTDIRKVNRLTPNELQVGYSTLQQDMRKTFVDQDHNIVDFVPNPPDNTTNVASVTMRLGQSNGAWFPNKSSAQMMAGKWLRLKTNDYTLVDTGSGYSINVTRNVDETKLGIRNLSVDTQNKAPDNIWTRFTGYLMGADTKLSQAQIDARGVAVMSAERTDAALGAFSKPLADLQKSDKAGAKELDDFMTANRDHVDPVKGRGVTYHTQPEFEDAFHSQFNKAPTLQQADAYWAYKQYYDTEWVARNYDVYKQKAIAGIEKFSVPRGTGSELSDAKDASSYQKLLPQEPLNFEGKVLDELPRGHEQDFSVGVIDDKGVLTKKYLSKYAKDSQWDEMNALITKGYKPIQAADGSVSVDGQYFNFVLSKNFTRDRPSLDLNYRDGTRTIQRYPWYVKQSRLSDQNGRWFYHGDLTLANARDSEDARFITEQMNRARILVKNGDPTARDFFERTFPQWSYDDFNRSLNAQGGRLDVPFVVARSGQRTIDSTNMRDVLSREGHSVQEWNDNNAFRLMNQVRGKFLGERNDVDMATWASEKGKIFELATGNKLTPMEAMRLSMGNLVDVNVMNDYKIKSVRDYTQQFRNLLQGTQSDWDSNGLDWIYNPKYLPGADPNEVRTAEGVRKAILSLWSQSTVVDRQISLYKEKLIRSLRGSLGDNVADLANDNILPKIQNADKYMRAYAFHSKMGVFNIKQLFLQTASVVNIVSISPRAGIKGAMLGYPIMMGLKAPDSMLGALGAKLAATTGVSPEDYTEMVRLFKKSGFDLVKNDVSYIDDLSAPKVIQGKLKPILDMGTEFFRTGERTARSMAFATAYLEKKAAGIAIDRNGEASILSRAKDLIGNMTRDSNAPYQQGYAAVASQFFGYQMRLAEQMLGPLKGGKLTLAERGRLFTGMSLMYGVPVAGGMTVGIWPVREWIKDWMNQSGIDTSNNPALDAFTDGFAQQLLHVMSGRKFDVSTPYGPGGISTFYDALKASPDTTWNDILLGASGGIIGDTAADADPIFKWFTASLSTGDVTSYPITANDLIKPLRDITTVNNAIKLEQAVNLGQWLSKNESVMSDITPVEAAISAVLGVDPQSVSDAFSKQHAMSVHSEVVKQQQKVVQSDYRLAVQALKSGNIDIAGTYFGRAKADAALGNLSPTQYADAVSLAMQEVPMDESTSARFAQFEQQQNAGN